MRNLKNYISDRAPLGIIVCAVSALAVSALHVAGAIFGN